MHVLAAVVGLVGALGGVVIGALLTEWRDRRRETRTKHDEVRIAARLVGQELQTSYTHVLEAGGRQIKVEADLWREHRAVLARVMDESGWRDVASAYSVLELVANGEPLSDGARRQLRRAQAKLDGLLIWTRDSKSEEEVLYGYQRHLEDLLGTKQADQRQPVEP